MLVGVFEDERGAGTVIEVVSSCLPIENMQSVTCEKYKLVGTPGDMSFVTELDDDHRCPGGSVSDIFVAATAYTSQSLVIASPAGISIAMLVTVESSCRC